MNSFLYDFLSYFFPNISSVPEWLQMFIGVILLTYFLKMIMFVIDRR